jgi:hypothetical protein
MAAPTPALRPRCGWRLALDSRCLARAAHRDLWTLQAAFVQEAIFASALTSQLPATCQPSIAIIGLQVCDNTGMEHMGAGYIMMSTVRTAPMTPAPTPINRNICTNPAPSLHLCCRLQQRTPIANRPATREYKP